MIHEYAYLVKDQTSGLYSIAVGSWTVSDPEDAHLLTDAELAGFSRNAESLNEVLRFAARRAVAEDAE